MAVIKPYSPKGVWGYSPIPLEPCCALTSCSSGSASPIRAWKIDCTTLWPCTPLPEWSAIPGETTIRTFRHLLEIHGLTGRIFAASRALLENRGLCAYSAAPALVLIHELAADCLYSVSWDRTSADLPFDKSGMPL